MARVRAPASVQWVLGDQTAILGVCIECRGERTINRCCETNGFLGTVWVQMNGGLQTVVSVGVLVVRVLNKNMRRWQVQIVGDLIDARGAIKVVHQPQLAVWVVGLDVLATQCEFQAADMQTGR